MSKPVVTVGPPTDLERFRATDQLVWFEEPEGLPIEKDLLGVPPDQRFAAVVEGGEDDLYAGIYGVRPMQLSVPGGRLVPLAGLTWVGVHPDQRRRGVLSAMMRHHVEQTHRDGVAVSGLHASEPVIYGRYGYGTASHAASLTVDRGATFTAPGLDDAAAGYETRLAPGPAAALVDRVRECELRVAETVSGLVIGAADFYASMFTETPQQLRDKEPMRFLFARRDGVDVGYAAFRRSHKWKQHRAVGTLEVLALFGGPAARLALLRRLVDFDLMGTVTLPGTAADDPLWHWLEPRSAHDVHWADNLWLRIVDLPAALPMRGYDGECDVVVELEDPLAPWQAGRWRVVVAGGEGRAERTETAADLVLPVAVLGTAYLGGTNLVTLQRAGLVGEQRAGAVADLWHGFRSDVPPAAAATF